MLLVGDIEAGGIAWLGNGRVGWLDPRAGGVQELKTPIALRIDLAHRRLELFDGGRVERRMPIAVGATNAVGCTRGAIPSNSKSGMPTSLASGPSERRSRR